MPQDPNTATKIPRAATKTQRSQINIYLKNKIKGKIIAMIRRIIQMSIVFKIKTAT